MPVFHTKESKKNHLERKIKIYQFLKKEGFNPVYYGVSDIFFTKNLSTLSVCIYPNDECYYKLVQHDIIDIRNKDDFYAALDSCNSSNSSMKIAKCHINESRKKVYIEVPAFHRTVDDFISICERMISQALSCHQDFIFKFQHRLSDVASEIKSNKLSLVCGSTCKNNSNDDGLLLISSR